MDNNNVQNVTAGKPFEGGAVFYAPLGTTIPTDALTELDAAFENAGYISEDGVVNTNTPTTQTTKAWGGDIVLSIQDEKTDTFSTVLIESLNVDVLKAYFGDENVTGTLADGITITVNSKELPEKAWVIDMIMRNGALKRVVIPRGKVTTTDEVTYVDNEAVGYGITITAYPDASGNTHYEYIKAAS